LKSDLFKNGGDREAGRGRKISNNIDEWIGGALLESVMVEKKLTKSSGWEIWGSRTKVE
jgi:hypothetical protein